MQYEKINKIKSWLGTGSINFFGPPFSGKDTQAKRIAEMIDGVVVSGGDILRHAKDNIEVQNIMANGGIIPSDLFLSIIPPFFSHDDINDKPLLLSSVGRLMEEVPTVIKATNDSGHEIKAVIVLELTDKDVWRHYEISQSLNDRGQRADDTKNALKKRLTEYNKTKPVIDYYRSMSLVLDIDDTKDTDDVTVEIIDALYSFATQS